MFHQLCQRQRLRKGQGVQPQLQYQNQVQIKHPPDITAMNDQSPLQMPHEICASLSHVHLKVQLNAHEKTCRSLLASKPLLRQRELLNLGFQLNIRRMPILMHQ